jgi:F0F1-type ATP synthase assembly protein I
MKITRVFAIAFMILGSLLVIVGALFKIQHWPDMFVGFISGPISMLIGVVLFIISLKNKKNNNAL